MCRTEPSHTSESRYSANIASITYDFGSSVENEPQEQSERQLVGQSKVASDAIEDPRDTLLHTLRMGEVPGDIQAPLSLLFLYTGNQWKYRARTLERRGIALECFSLKI